jgi:SSS family solute:Na+ symporter
MLTRDLVDPLTKGQAASRRASPWVGKGFVIVLALTGLAIAWRPPATFLEIATETFGAIASILVGEGLVVAYHLHLLPTFGTLPVIPVVLVASLVLIGVSLLTQPQAQATEEIRNGKKGIWKWIVAFLLLFILGNDYWAWGDGRLGPLGFPWWVWYFFSLCLLMSLTFWLFARDRCDRHEAHRNDS